LILDLDGNGIRTRDLSAGVLFDLHADGTKVATGWVGQGDGLLALDRNHDGVIGDGSELFGTSTASAANGAGNGAGNGGAKARDGFAALADIDGNGDGVIDRQDALFGDLRVWVDANADGVSQSGELKSLDALGIASMALGATKTSELDNGNWIGLRSSYNGVDGSVNQMADVWFRAERAAQVSAMTQALGSYAQSQAAPDASAQHLTMLGGTMPAGGQASSVSGAAGLNGNVAALTEQLRQYQSHTGLSNSASAHTDEWFRKQTVTGMLAAK
jgi:hypothetical protein